MKNLFLIACLVVLAAFVNAQQQVLNPSDFEKAIQKGDVQVLDVRRADEYKSGHIAHSLQADWLNQDQFKERVAHLDKDKPIYVYCAAGVRSAAAAKWLRENKYSQVYELGSGFTGWQKENKPVEGKSSKPQMTQDEFSKMIPQKGKVLVDIGAEWCPPCQKMAPVMAELKKQNQYKIVNVDAGNDIDMVKVLKAEAYPTFIVYNNGKEVWRKQGIVSKEELTKHLR